MVKDGSAKSFLGAGRRFSEVLLKLLEFISEIQEH
jgi:hypothetical protein